MMLGSSVEDNGGRRRRRAKVEKRRDWNVDTSLHTHVCLIPREKKKKTEAGVE